MQQQFKNELEQTGLSAGQAMIYECLLERGHLPASILKRHLPYSRQMVYNILDELIELNVVEKIEKQNKVARFAVTHPDNLRLVLEIQKKKIETASASLEVSLPTFTSYYNIQSGKPGVRFTEGREGVESMLASTLANKDEVVYSYADTETIEKYVKDINSVYVKKRKARGIKKKILMMDSSLAREKAKKTINDTLTEIRLISAKNNPSVPAVLEVYNNQVSYITFTKGMFTTTTLHDQTLYTLHRFLFESHWESATQIQ